MTLRTKGDRGDQCNFITELRGALFEFHVDTDHVTAVEALPDKYQAS